MNIFMLNISFLACTKVELRDLTVCIAVNGEKFRSHAVTLTSTMLPNIELVRDIFINNVFQYHVLRSITFLVILQKHTHKDAHTQRL